MKNIWCVLCFMLCAARLLAQQCTITGQVADAADKNPVIGAGITVKHENDSINTGAAATDIKGAFVLKNIPYGTYILHIKYTGYRAMVIKIKADTPVKNIGRLLLKPDSAAIDEVVVVGTLTPVEQHGDTIQYNASAFKTDPDDQLEELLNKLPGISIDNGTVKAHGEPIEQIFLDGKPYFGGDLQSALKNIPAETIDKIQIYYKQSDLSKFTGIDDGQSVKVINIITRKDKRNGQFGKALAGVTSNRLYKAEGNLNLFKNNRRITITGESSNANNGAYGGTSTTHAAGINYNDSIGRKVYLNASYNFRNSAAQVQSDISRTYLGTNSLYHENSGSGSNNYSHNVYLQFQSNFDTLNTLAFTPSISFQNSDYNSLTNASTATGEGVLQSRTAANNNTGTGNMTVSGNLLYGHRFKKAGRTLSFSFNGSYSQADGNTDLNARNEFFGSHDSVSAYSQQSDNGNLLSSYSPSLVYTEPIDKKSLIQLNYNVNYSQSISKKLTYNYDSLQHEYIDFDTSVSSLIHSASLSQSAGIAYRLNEKKFFINAGLNYKGALLTGYQTYPAAYTIQKNFADFLPSAIFNYKFSAKSNINLTYQTSTQLPSVNQLRTGINNNNPLLLYTGNPNLRDQYMQVSSVRYGFPVDTVSSLYFGLSGTLTSNSITTASVFASKDSILEGGYLMPKGAQLNYPVNVDGTYSLRSTASYSLSVAKLNLNVNAGAGYAYTVAPGIANYMHIYTRTGSWNASISLIGNAKEKLYYVLSCSPAYNTVVSSNPAVKNNNYFSQNTRGSLKWTIWKGLVVHSDINYYSYKGNITYAQQHTSWNAGMGWKFLKKRNAEIQFYVYDILNQGSNLNRTVTDLYIQDQQTNIQTRYFMLTFIYNLRNYTPIVDF